MDHSKFLTLGCVIVHYCRVTLVQNYPISNDEIARARPNMNIKVAFMLLGFDFETKYFYPSPMASHFVIYSEN